MGYLHCCSGLRHSRTFVVVPKEGYLICELDVVEVCPVCDNFVVQLTRIDLDNQVSIVRKSNRKGKQLFEKLKSDILYEKGVIKGGNLKYSSKFYLSYSEYGVKKRCYSNISSMQMGKYSCLDWEMPGRNFLKSS